MKHSTRLLVIITAAVSTVAFAGAGWAFWATRGNGSASGRAGTLNPPMTVTPNSTAGSGTVVVTWTAPTGGMAPTGYYVYRTTGATTTAACTSPAALRPPTPTSCSDTGVPDGTYTYKVTAVLQSWTAQSDASGSITVITDTTAPTVTINQAPSQSDPTNSGTMNFTVVFSEPVTGFANADVILSGTANLGAATKTISGGPSTYNVALSGITGNGPVTATIAAGAAQDAAANDSAAGTSTDNSVTLDTTAPTATIDQKAGQADPTNGTIEFTVTFSEPVVGFATVDVTVTGTTGGTKVATVTGSGTTYNVAVTGATGNGTVIATIAANVAQDLAGNNNVASTSMDNVVTLDAVAPTAFSLSIANGSGSSGLPDLGDKVTLTFSEQIITTTILGGWTGSATNVVVRSTNGTNGANDTLTFFNSANSTQLPLGTIDLGSKEYFTGSITFGASGTASSMSAVTTDGKTVITITLGTASDTTKTAHDGNDKSDADWTASSTVTDLVGNAVNTATPARTGNIKQF